MPPFGHWGDEFASNPGDPALLMWQMSLQAHAAGSGHVLDLMQGNIFYDHTDVLAYSENLIAYLPIFGPVLRLTGDNPIAAYNALALVGYTASCVTVFALAHHLLGARLPSLLAAIVFGAASYHTASLNHVQLIGIAFVPLGLLALMKLCERPRSTLWAVVLGASVGLAWLSSLYCAIMLAVALPVAFAVWALTLRLRVDGSIVPRIAVAVAAAVVLIAPTLPAYLRVQSTGANTRRVDELITVNSGSFSSLPPSALWSALGHGTSELIEQDALFPGVVATLLAAGGAAVLLVLIARNPPWRQAQRADAPDVFAERRRMWALPLLAVLVVCGLVMIGPRRRAPLGWPDQALRALVPGMSDLRDLVRFWLLGLALVGVAAGVGALWLMRRVGPRFGGGVVVALAALCAAESLYRVADTTVALAAPQTDANTVLASLPSGPVVELPLEPPGSFPYALSVAPNQLRSVVDGHPRIEGYSGNIPADSHAAIEVARLVPDSSALLTLRRLGVRYLVLHGGPVACWGTYGPGEMRLVVSALTLSDGVERIVTAGSDDVVVLQPARPALSLSDISAPATPAAERPVPPCP